ncbi:MAG: CinA family nicotinamide mononucleotide deamidase-related protein [Myxococcales bacterium]|nr:CinA family nicotinamide mononucleotide deamidase-related protein [Myxococcales bacterium]
MPNAPSTAATTEVLTIGDELLRGELVDSNSAWLAGRLGELGLPASRFSTASDELGDIVEQLRSAAGRCSALMVSGGLGPTEDDRTAQAVAQAAGVELELHEAQLEAIKARFAAVSLPFTDNNAKQAWLPHGALVLDNDIGTAPGFSVKIGGCRVFCMPGVPRELMRMFDRHVASVLESELGGQRPELRRVKVFGLAEAQVDHMLRGLGDGIDGRGCTVTIHYRATFPEIHASVVVRGGEGGAAGEVADAYAEAMAERLAGNVFARDAATSFADALVATLREHGATVAFAESCTGGRTGDLITNAAGSSDVFLGSLVTYSNSAKEQLLGVPSEVLQRDGAVSQRCVEAMARGARERFGSDYAVAISGVAGPGGGSAEKPVGTVHFALAGPDGLMRHVHRVFRYGERDRVKQVSAYVAAWLVYRALTAPGADDVIGKRWAPRGTR